MSNTEKTKLAYLAGKEKSLALYLNSARQKLASSLSNINEEKALPVIRNEVALELTKNILNNIINEKKQTLQVTDKNSTKLETITEIVNDSRSLLSVTTEECKNNFIPNITLKYIINPYNDNIEFGDFCPADGMTDNKNMYITDYYEMSPKLAQAKLDEWYAKKEKLITAADKRNENEIKDLFKELTDLKKAAKKQGEELYTAGISSVDAKNAIKQYTDKFKNKIDLEKAINEDLNSVDQETKKNANIAKAKYDLAIKMERINDIENKIDAKINEYNLRAEVDMAAMLQSQNIQTEARKNLAQYKEDKKNGKNVDTKNYQPILREMAGNTPGFKHWTDAFEGRLNSLTLSGTKEKGERNKLSEMLGLMYVYSGKITSKKSLDDERFKVVSKTITRIKEESKEEYFERLKTETVNDRNEGLAKLTNFDANNLNRFEFYGEGKPIETVQLSVPNVQDFNGKTTAEKAKNAILSEDGIMQLYPILSYFGKEGFKNGVFVYDVASNQKINAGTYDDILDSMNIKMVQMKTITINKLPYQDWQQQQYNWFTDYANIIARYSQEVDKFIEIITKPEKTAEEIKEIENINKKIIEKSKGNIPFCYDALQLDFKDGEKRRVSVNSLFSITTPSTPSSRQGSGNSKTSKSNQQTAQLQNIQSLNNSHKTKVSNNTPQIKPRSTSVNNKQPQKIINSKNHLQERRMQKNPQIYQNNRQQDNNIQNDYEEEILELNFSRSNTKDSFLPPISRPTTGATTVTLRPNTGKQSKMSQRSNDFMKRNETPQVATRQPSALSRTLSFERFEQENLPNKIVLPPINSASQSQPNIEAWLEHSKTPIPRPRSRYLLTKQPNHNSKQK